MWDPAGLRDSGGASSDAPASAPPEDAAPSGTPSVARGGRGRLQVLAAAAVPLILFSFVMLVLYVLDREQELRERFHHEATTTVAAVDRLIDAEIAALAGLSASPALDDGRFDQFRRHLDREMEQRKTWLSVSLADRDGQILNTRHPQGAALPPLLDRGSVLDVFATERPYISGVHIDESRGPEPFFMIRVPVIRNGAVRYVLTASLSAWSLHPLLADGRGASTWRLSLIDRDQRFIARSASGSRHDPRIGMPPSPWTLAALRAPDDGFSHTTSADGEKVAIIAATSPLTEWTLLCAANAWAVSGSTRAALLAVGIGALLALGLAGALFRAFLRIDRDHRAMERRLSMVTAEQHYDRRLSEIVANFPGLIFRRRLRHDGGIDYPHVAAGREFLGRLGLPSLDRADASAMVQAAMSEATRRRWRDAITESARTMATYSIELQVDVGGTQRWVRSIAAPHREPDGTVVWDGVALDITEAREAAEAREEAKKMAEAANEAKTRFLAAASHDLRQPVQSLFLFLAAVSAATEGQSVHKAVRHMEDALVSLKGMLDRLLDISKLDAGNVSAQARALPVGDVLGQLDAEYGPRAAAKGLSWACTGCDGWVLSDPLLLERLLRNLLENALRHTQQGGISLRCQASGDQLRITVEDTGTGIPDDELERIFTEFYQITGTKRAGGAGGLGLGLSIVRRLADLLDHRVSVQSEVGTGSAFTVDLARIAPPASDGRPARADAAPDLPYRRRAGQPPPETFGAMREAG